MTFTFDTENRAGLGYLLSLAQWTITRIEVPVPDATGMGLLYKARSLWPGSVERVQG